MNNCILITIINFPDSLFWFVFEVFSNDQLKMFKDIKNIIFNKFKSIFRSGHNTDAIAVLMTNISGES